MSATKRAGVFILRSSARSEERDDPSRSPSSDSSPDRTEVLWHPAGAEQDDDSSFSPLELTVRTARLTDLVPLVRVATVLRLNQPEINLHPYRPVRAAASRFLRWRQNRPRVFVACAGDRLVGFAHWQPVLPDRRWQLIALGSSTGVYDAAPVWEELVRHATTAAGLRGVKRLYARVPVGAPAVEAVRRVGFNAYASETVFLAQQLHSAPGVIPLRAQEQTDTWAIHQLYNSAVPKQVQFAEAWTSHRWDVRVGGSSDVVTRGWLAEEGHQLLGYVRVSSHGSTHVMELIYAPDNHAILPGLLDGVIARLRGVARVGRVYCALRGYQAEAVAALSERGFDPVLEQDLHVKYTTATARVPQPETVPFHAEVIERLPKRVPSFLHGKPGDGTAIQ
ncbi:MAG TPA: hypothetical protein VH482_31775 [Thermomicrobiales bacterium]|jgi:hypothetical protein